MLSFLCLLTSTLFPAALLPQAPTRTVQEEQEKSADTRSKAAPLERVELADVANVHRTGRLLLAGQPGPEGLANLAGLGVSVVIDLRKPGEVTAFDEPARVQELGMQYISTPFGGPPELTSEVLDRVRGHLQEHASADVVLHCGSAHRVGAVWLAARVLDEGVAWPEALAEARRVGLRSPGYVAQVRNYVLRASRPEWAEFLDSLAARFPDVDQVDADTLVNELEGAAPPVLFDVREAQEYAVSHLPGAQLATTIEQAEAHLAGEPKDRAVVVYCSVGYRSSELAGKLTSRGYTNVRNLHGSIFGWANDGRAVVRSGERVGVVHPYDKSWGRFLDRSLWSDL